MQNNNFSNLHLMQQQQQSPNDNLYQRLMEMRTNTPYNSYRTVFNDISDEWGACTEEERRFIEKDQEYMQANLEYAQQFNAFLLDQFGLQFASSKYGTSAEKVLLSMRNARGRYRTSAVEDMNKIKSENAALHQQLKELEALINAK